MSEHIHEWTLLWSHLGEYGRQDVHFHQCFTCDAMLYGPGRDCDGALKTHRADVDEIPEPVSDALTGAARDAGAVIQAVKRYRTIVADPPWEVARSMGRGGRRANPTEVPYSMMTLDAIKALPVHDFIDDERGTVLFLWSTRKAFREGWAVQVARAWGFEPCGELIWGLRNPGMGTTTLSNDHEPVLIAKSGKWAQLSADESLGVHFWKQVYEWNPKAKVPQKKHSAKPPGFLELIEQIALGPRLEMFAREQRLGWDTWGNEALNHVEIGTA